ncbi:hypothetical protein BDQ17DRAFT_1372419 [Cyathus striatus]|nr:hypothetical protein BDQ17DRAFT_1372419 [Cyathus striatus]
MCHTCGRRRPRAWRYGPIGIPPAGCSTFGRLPVVRLVGNARSPPSWQAEQLHLFSPPALECSRTVTFPPLPSEPLPYAACCVLRNPFSSNRSVMFIGAWANMELSFARILRAFTCQVSNARVVDLGFG